MSEIDLLALGEKLGKLASSIDANTKAAESNTAALAEGRKEFAAIHADIKEIKSTAPCLKGQPLPPGCPGITQTQALPLPAQEKQQEQEPDIVEAVKGGQTFILWARKRWHLLASAGLFIGSIVTFWKALFSSGTPPHP